MVSDEEFLSQLTLSSLSLFADLVWFVCSSRLCPQHVRPDEIGSGRCEGRVQLGVGGVIRLSVTFEDAQTALQQLEVSLGMFQLQLCQFHQVLSESCHSSRLKVYELLLGRL